MKKADFTLELIKDNRMLGKLAETLADKQAIALDIETTEWWNRHREKISLVQLRLPEWTAIESGGDRCLCRT